MLIGADGEPFDDPGFLYELKLDGERCLAYLSADGTEFRNKRHKLMNPHIPELCDIHKQSKKKCILDGELVVMVNGVPNFAEIQRRSLTRHPFKLNLAAKKLPAVYTAFDILYYDGVDVTLKPLIERKKILAKAFKESDRLALSRYIEEHGNALYALAEKQNLEGIVAKNKNSIYKMNSRTKDWIKIKYLKDEDFVVYGYIIKEKETRGVISLLLGAYQDGTLIHQGHVTLGMSRREFDIIANHKKRPLSPTGYHEEGAVYIEPTLVCSVKYMERTANGGLRQPVFKSLRDDKDAKECLLGLSEGPTTIIQ